MNQTLWERIRDGDAAAFSELFDAALSGDRSRLWSKAVWPLFLVVTGARR